MKNSIAAFALLIASSVFAQVVTPTQSQIDSIKTAKIGVQELETVTVTPFKQSPDRQPEIKGNVLYSGKKNEVLNLANIYDLKIVSDILYSLNLLSLHFHLIDSNSNFCNGKCFFYRSLLRH